MAKAYIDTEELLNTLEDYIEYNTFDIYQEEPLINMSFEQLEDIVTSQPTADVVEVIRCKNCRYGEIDDPDIPNQYLCHYDGESWNDEDHYCSYGKKVK